MDHANVDLVGELYRRAVETPSDIHQHCPLLRALAARCEVVVELGTRYGVSTSALLAGRPRRLVAIDLVRQSNVDSIEQAAEEMDFTFVCGSSLEVDIPPCDLLLIDTLHTADQLWSELNRHSHRVRRWIALHDTETFGAVGEDGGPGLLAALQRFLRRNPEWRPVHHACRNNGMTVLARSPLGALDFEASDPIPECLSSYSAQRSRRPTTRSRSSSQINCYLTVYEQLVWPQKMAEQCQRLGLTPILLDNGSTYEPLLVWLEKCPYEVIRVGSNAGCYGFWNMRRHHEQTDVYVVSDSDLDLSGVPDDAVERMRRELDHNPDVAKVGLSLEIDDLPEVYPFKQDVIAWEQKFWTMRRGECWLADIGATFALYDPARNALLDQNFYTAVRLDRPYTARHLPWYLNFDELTDELRYYFSRCDDLAYWGSRSKRRLQESHS